MSEKKPSLFIGGPADGKRVYVDDKWRTVEITTEPSAPVSPGRRHEPSFEIVPYRPERIDDMDGVRHTVFLAPDVKNPIERLIEGYRDKVEPKSDDNAKNWQHFIRLQNEAFQKAFKAVFGESSPWEGHEGLVLATPQPAAIESRYRFLLALLIERGVLTDKRYGNGTWSLQGIYGVDDSDLRGAGRTPEEAIDSAITMAGMVPHSPEWQEAWKSAHEAAQARPSANPAVAAILFAIEADEGIAFLDCWNDGRFDVCRREWPEAPESCYIGADPLHPETQAAQPERTDEAATLLNWLIAKVTKTPFSGVTLQRMGKEVEDGQVIQRAGYRLMWHHRIGPTFDTAEQTIVHAMIEDGDLAANSQITEPKS